MVETNTSTHNIESNTEKLLKDVIILVSRTLLESGAEGSRVEDTMSRIATALGFPESNSYVTNTVINFMLHDDSTPRIFRINGRDTNLRRISLTNHISRQLVNGQLTLEEAKARMLDIRASQQQNDLLYKCMASGVISIAFLYLQNGHWYDVIATLIAGTLGYFVVEFLSRKLNTHFIPEFMGSLIIGIIAVAGHTLIPEASISAIIIASVMPIVPGVLITNAIQDLFGGHLMMFTTKSLEALVTSFAIGTGVGTVLIIY